MPLKSSVKLNTGAEMPTLGLGTWRSAPGEVEKAVEVALKAGYKSIDTATGYQNEKEVGDGIKASGVPRESFFLTTKLSNTDHRRVPEAFQDSLTKLGTTYLDLWLMHWPAPMKTEASGIGADRDWDWRDTWRAMEKIYKEHPDKVKAIGVSNFSEEFFDELLKIAEVVPAVNQIELHPSCNQTSLVAYCLAKGVSVTAYSPLGSLDSPLHENSIIKKIAEKHGVSTANILVSLQANKPGVTVIAKSVSPERILANMKLVELSQEEMNELATLEKGSAFRVCKPWWTGHGDLGFLDCRAQGPPRE
ncbi:Aldo/keto reductase [Irpex rosettiformis]|uniref:Aldo/keto reductase n=1 Tax=Irpex rosettiformis TaxID=378272 RepID=A0ACB8U886_9APHY|nr:Aldo/keto reductase [Irpex rosettiformis]